MRFHLRAALAALLLAAAPLARAEPSVPEARLLALVNAERERRGLRGLAWDEALAEAARAHARDMRSAGEISHVGSDGRELVDRVAGAGLALRHVAENVARAGGVEEAHRALMASRGHRENLLDEELEIAGFGVIDGEDGAWVVQNFGIPAARRTEAQARAEILREVQARGWALAEDPELSLAVEPHARAMAERDTASLRGLANPGCWMIGSVGPEAAELPARAPTCRARRAGIAATWERTKQRPLGAWFVVIAVAP